MKNLKIGQNMTTRDAESLAKYFNDIGKIELLRPDEEITLASKIREGDLAALERMIESNLRFVVSIAKHYQNNGLSLGDLISEGNMGLIKAASRFDETRGFKFISFAVYSIRQSIIYALMDQVHTVRLPQNLLSSLSRIDKITAILLQELERNPSIKEISERMEMLEDKVKYCLRNSRISMSLDSIIDEDFGNTLMEILINDTPDPDTVLITESTVKAVNMILRSLPKKEREILELYYGLAGKMPIGLNDIAERFKLSKERVRQIKDCTIKKLKRRSKAYCKKMDNY